MDKQFSLLTEALKTSTGLADLFESEAFQQNIVPHLEKLSKVGYIDPLSFKSREEYQFALDSANIKAGTYHELLTFLKQQRVISERLIKQMEDINKKQKYERGEI